MALFKKHKTEPVPPEDTGAHDTSVGTAADVEAVMKKYDRESNTRVWEGLPKLVIRWLMVAFSAYCIIDTVFLSTRQEVRLPMFVGLILLFGFLTFPAKKGDERVNHMPWYDIVLLIAGPGAYFFYAVNAQNVVQMSARVMQNDLYMIIGLIGILALVELCRRCVGLPILCVAGVLLVYTFFNLGGSADFKMTLYQVIRTMFYTFNGIFGGPISVCAKFIVVFIIFGAFLERTGIAQFFINLANAVAGAAPGGPAKVAVISSALCGMVSGSSVGNTVTTGAVTIPLMKRTGYPPEFAGAVEAAASTGGQIMPPIMGAAAFLMAEMTDTEYADILVRAILPAALYFTGIFLMVHFKAKSIGLKGLDKDSLPKGKDIFPKLYLLLPLIVLVFMVIQSGTFTMAYSAVVACLVAIVAGMADRETGSKKFVMMVPAIPLLVYALGKVYLPDVIPAFADSLEMQEAFTLVCFGIFFVLVVACHLISKPNMQNVGTYINALESGTKSTLSVGVACGMAGIIAGVVTYTGLGQILINAIVGIAGGHLIIALVLTMVCCVILGMGVPTTANYIIMATTCAPILIQMGLPVLAAHFFVFYFGIVADITPPVALAAYAGSAIAKAPPMKTALNATRLAIAAFIIPYIFAYSPIMLFIGDDVNAINVIRVVITSFGGMFLIAAGLIGFMLQKLNIVLRLVSVAAGLMMIHPGALTDVIGIAILIAILAYQVISEKRHAATA